MITLTIFPAYRRKSQRDLDRWAENRYLAKPTSCICGKILKKLSIGVLGCEDTVKR